MYISWRIISKTNSSKNSTCLLDPTKTKLLKDVLPLISTLEQINLSLLGYEILIQFHSYADDTQLYLAMKLDETNQLLKLQACFKYLDVL